MKTLEKIKFQDINGEDVIFRIVETNGILIFEKIYNLTYTIGVYIYNNEKGFRKAIKNYEK